MDPPASGGKKLNNLLLRLRQVCNHPFLLGPDAEPADYSPAQFVAYSSKLALLAKLLPRLRSEGHRVLLFSTFTQTLDLVEEFLAGQNITDYCRLDGCVTP
jgi:SNF2 family DNA or RNA helicase